MSGKISGYSSVQVGLHWAVVVIVAFQFLAHSAIESAWTTHTDGDVPSQRSALLAYMHIVGGMLILMLALCRIYLRLTRGAPEPPRDEPRIMKIISESVHGLIYVLLISLPLSGAIAWFWRWDWLRSSTSIYNPCYLGSSPLTSLEHYFSISSAAQMS